MGSMFTRPVKSDITDGIQKILIHMKNSFGTDPQKVGAVPRQLPFFTVLSLAGSQGYEIFTGFRVYNPSRF